MPNRLPIIIGLIATAFAVVFNLAPAARTDELPLAFAAFVAALVAGTCGVWSLRKGQRFLAVAMIGPAVFVLAESAIRLLLALKHG